MALHMLGSVTDMGYAYMATHDLTHKLNLWKHTNWNTISHLSATRKHIRCPNEKPIYQGPAAGLG